jgi:hypothetical protein
VLTLSELAGVLGVPEEELRRALSASSDQLPASVRALRNDGTFVRRDALDADFAALVTGLDLGKPYSRQDLLGGTPEGDTNGETPDDTNTDDPTSTDDPTDTDDPTTTDAPPDTTSDPAPDGEPTDGTNDPTYP